MSWFIQNLKSRMVKIAMHKRKKGKNTLEKIVWPSEFSCLFTFLASFEKRGAKLDKRHYAFIGRIISSNIAVSKVTAGYCKIEKNVAKKSDMETSFAAFKICSTGILSPRAS